MIKVRHILHYLNCYRNTTNFEGKINQALAAIQQQGGTIKDIKFTHDSANEEQAEINEALIIFDEGLEK